MTFVKLNFSINAKFLKILIIFTKKCARVRKINEFIRENNIFYKNFLSQIMLQFFNKEELYRQFKEHVL